MFRFKYADVAGWHLMAVKGVQKAWRLPMRNTGMRLNRVQPSLQQDLKTKKKPFSHLRI